MTEPIKPVTCESCLRDVTRHMDAYYYGFSTTGVREVDNILCSVALAGKAYHHTEDWNEGGYPELIQKTAADAAAKIKALELERDTIQEYADQVGANLRAAEGTLAERDEQIARYEDLLIDIKLALSNTKTFYLPLAEAVADIIRRKKEADRGAI